jgi:hypothetical protein
MSSEGNQPDILTQACILIDAALEGLETPEQGARLESLLLEHKMVRRLYVRYLHQECALASHAVTLINPLQIEEQVQDSSLEQPLTMHDAWVFQAIKDQPEQRALPIAVEPKPRDHRRTFPRTSRIPLPWRIAAAVVLPLVLGLAGWMVFGSSRSTATFAASIDAQWDWGAAPQLRERLPAKLLNLKAGLAEVRFESGAEMIVEGPSQFRIRSDNGVDLHAGRLTAVVPASAHGFAVHTPSATAVDLGTEFGVAVPDDHSTHIEVFRGKVEARPLHPADSTSAVEVMTAGQSGDVTADAAVVTEEPPADSSQFVRQEEFNARVSASDGSHYQRWLAYSYQLRRDPDLVAYYTFDNAGESPDRLPNRSSLGSVLDGILGEDDPQAKPAWTTGRWPQKGALAFDAIHYSHVIVHSGIGDPLDFSRGDLPGKPFTIAEWIRVDVQSDGLAAIVVKGFVRVEQFGMQTSAALEPRGWVRRQGEPPDALGCSANGSPISLGRWTHLAMTYDPTLHSIRLYVNGQLAAQRDDAPERLLQTDQPMTIGARRGSKSDDGTISHLPSFEGCMDELAIFRRALSAGQVQEIYLGGKPD